MDQHRVGMGGQPVDEGVKVLGLKVELPGVMAEGQLPGIPLNHTGPGVGSLQGDAAGEGHVGAEVQQDLQAQQITVNCLERSMSVTAIRVEQYFIVERSFLYEV